MDPARLDELKQTWDLQTQNGFFEDVTMILPPGLKYDDTEIGDAARSLVNCGRATWEQSHTTND